MTSQSHIPQEDLALYAMEALSPEDSVAVREHLQGCSQCRAELAMLSGDLALLAMAAGQKPVPARAKGRLVPHPAAEKPAPKLAPPVTIPKRPRTAMWLLPISCTAVGALVFLAISLDQQLRLLRQQVRQASAVMRQQSAELRQQQAANERAQRALELLTAPRAQHVELTAGGEKSAPAARVIYLASQGALLMQASNLNPILTDKTYELWVVPTEGPSVPAGLFRPDASGSASVVLPELPKGIEARAFDVTLEDARGSATPTLPIVLSGPSSASGANAPQGGIRPVPKPG